MSIKYKYLLLVIGPTKSGKSSTVNMIVQDYKNHNAKINRIIPVTTRPKRKEDEFIIEYEFIDDNKFEELKHNNELVSCSEYDTINGIYKYGVKRSDFDTIVNYTNNILITNIEELEQLINYIPDDVSPLIINLYASKEELLKRNNSQRGEEETVRRINKDYEDYLKKRFKLTNNDIPILDVNCDNSSVYIVAEYIERTFENMKADDIKNDILKNNYTD